MGAVRSKRIRGCALLLSAALALGGMGGCVQKSPPTASTQIFSMDTIMTLTLYGDGAEQTLPMTVALIDRLEKELSVTDPDSDVYAINHSEGQWTALSPDTATLIGDALQLCRRTDGALDITAFPAVRAWGFTTQAYRVPDEAELTALRGLIDYSAVELDEQQLALPRGMAMDLGAVAKGYTGQRLAALLAERGITSALCNLGGNVQTVGSRPNGDPWRIGIQDPLGDGYLGVVSVRNQAVITSGGYQRYFQQDGQTYWHIFDPATAAPASTDLLSVTVIGDSGLVCDALSTALFVMGQERAAAFWRDNQDLGFDVLFVNQDGAVSVTQGLAERFSLSNDYPVQEVALLR